jgi:hypothetical protein
VAGFAAVANRFSLPRIEPARPFLTSASGWAPNLLFPRGVGNEGRVIAVAPATARRPWGENVELRESLIESLPIAHGCADVVILTA